MLLASKKRNQYFSGRIVSLIIVPHRTEINKTDAVLGENLTEQPRFAILPIIRQKIAKKICKESNLVDTYRLQK